MFNLPRNVPISTCFARSCRRLYASHPAEQVRSPRIIFSGIQPTGIPHVWLFHANSGLSFRILNYLSARKLPGCPLQLGQVAKHCLIARRSLVLHRRLACSHAPPRSRSPRRFASRHSRSPPRNWSRSQALHHLSSRPRNPQFPVRPSSSDSWPYP